MMLIIYAVKMALELYKIHFIVSNYYRENGYNIFSYETSVVISVDRFKAALSTYRPHAVY